MNNLFRRDSGRAPSQVISDSVSRTVDLKSVFADEGATRNGLDVSESH